MSWPPAAPRANTSRVTDLGTGFELVLGALAGLGAVQIETPNSAASIETSGSYSPLLVSNGVAHVEGDALRLRCHLGAWSRAQAIVDVGQLPRQCIEFLDARSRVLHRARVTDPAHARSFERVVEWLTDDARARARDALPRARSRSWLAPVAAREGHPVGPDALARVLDAAEAVRLDVQLTIGNDGCSQTCTGRWRVEHATSPVLLTASTDSGRVFVRHDPGSMAWVVRDTPTSPPALDVLDKNGLRMLRAEVPEPHDDITAARWARLLERVA